MNDHIVSLQAENIKRLKAIHIKPDGNFVVIGGRNAQGKSSVLDSIEYALQGGKSLPPRTLRDGTDHGHIVLETPDLVIKRTFTASGNSNLVVCNRQNNLKLSSPQAILDKLAGQLTFDPLAFARMEPKKQNVVLRQLLGLDFAELDGKRLDLYNERTLRQREVKELEARYKAAHFYPTAPEQECSITKITDEINKKRFNNMEREKLVTQLEYMEEEQGELEVELKNLQDKIKENAAAIKQITSVIDGIKAESVADLEKQLSEAEGINVQVRANAEHHRLEQEWLKAQDDVEKCNKGIKEIDEEKEHLIFSAPMPIEGLAFSDEGVTYKGIPFEQCSSAEQLKISIAMGIALNPELKILLIRDGSLCDRQSLAMIKDMAEKAGCQVWMEVVGKGQNVSVVIEDGQVESREPLTSNE